MASAAPPAGIGTRLASAGWIKSPSFDFFLLICAPLVTVPIMAGVYFRIPVLAITAALALAFTHYSSTLAFYFWDENRDYHRQHWFSFYAAPALIAVVYLTLVGFRVPYIIQFVLFFWNTWHVARQNCGILSLYRTQAGVSAPEQKVAANRAIVAVAMFLCVWNLGTHEEIAALFGAVSPDLVGYVQIVAGAVAAFYFAQFVLAMIRRTEPLGLPEALFLITSFAFFYPYLLLHDSNSATLIMLLPHYVQYLTLVWLLHRRKFGAADAAVPPALRLMSTKLVVLVPILLIVGYAFAEFHGFADRRGWTHWWEALYLLIAFEHFYMDGLIWAFRRGHVRATILPHLATRRGSPG